ncbi:hypothetical protein K2173_024766 [Erythroxylum novogranatense]|uniref:GBF-interacting protein 1 N-terminal domain-containing protein n=1 Tax=Erythroxylum novogranatense TaxID=1862640 RepID=A0AAV8SWB3_9ROSI|nr:hypothetical protein K2173_024766 [Erythroxylum novogranatense]
MVAGTSSLISTTGTQFQAQPQTHTLSARVRKTIQSIKEIVGDFSDADIYMSLKESNMDPNETTQKLLNQDPFHEVKRKRDKKKENTGYNSPVDVKKQPENIGQGMKPRAISDRNARRGGYARTSLASNGGISREFRVVRDNRVNHNADNLNPVFLQAPTSSNERGVANIVEKGLTGTSSYVKHSDARSSYEFSNGHHNLQARHARDVNASVNERKIVSEEKQTVISNAASGLQVVKPSNSQHHPAALASSNSVVGVYSSSTDPVHVPSPESRPSAAVGAIKREVGVVGGRRQSFETAIKDISASVSSFSNSVLGRDGSVSESFRPFPAVSKTNQVGQTSATEPVMPSITVSRSFLSNQYNSRPHQTVGHQKAPQQNKEWKPKSNQKSSAIIPGLIGTPTKSNSPSADNCKESESDATDLQDKLSRVSIHGNQNVIIAEHIRVPENDRCKLTFGSLGLEFDSSKNFVSEFQSGGVVEESNGESAESNTGGSFNVSAKESSDEASGSKQTDLLDDKVRNSESDSPASVMVSENQLPDNPSSPPNLDSYSEIGLVRENSPSYTPSESQQQQGHPEMSNFSGYDSQTGYDMSYFRPPIDEAVRGQGLPSPQEALTPHIANGMSASVPMIQQQQQPPMAQMYQQVHVSHFPNIMPYRQFLSPVYVPQMAMPGYSSNPAYPHPSNGNSYLLMPGGGSHLSANGLKYGIQQFKPVPGNNPGFGNFTSPPGYAINAPGVVGNATGLEDSSRIKYKEGSLYVPNPQAETSDLWIQNPRELSGLQSAPYYNVPGQTPHPTYLPSHAAGHTSFNAAAAQSQHMQFQGLYPPPPQPAAMASAHHLGPVMGGNVGVGVAPAAPGAQVGAYQPQLGHLSWTSNF